VAGTHRSDSGASVRLRAVGIPSVHGGEELNCSPIRGRLAEGRNARGGYTIGAILADGVDLGGPSLPEKSNEHDVGATGERETVGRAAETSPMIARTAALKLVVEKLDEARESMDRILLQHKGYVAHLSASAESGSADMVVAFLRVPVDQFDVCLAELKKLGHVAQESQAGEEVTQQHMDLLARLKNSRNTEVRLTEVLRQHNGPIKEILDVEKESARVRGEIEQLEAEQQTLEHRVNFATIEFKLAEEYRAQLSTPAPPLRCSFATRSSMASAVLSRASSRWSCFSAESGPTLLLWLMILSFPGLAALAALSALPRDGFSLGSLRLRNSPQQILSLLRNRLHRLEMVVFT